MSLFYFIFYAYFFNYFSFLFFAQIDNGFYDIIY